MFIWVCFWHNAISATEVSLPETWFIFGRSFCEKCKQCSVEVQSLLGCVCVSKKPTGIVERLSFIVSTEIFIAPQTSPQISCHVSSHLTPDKCIQLRICSFFLFPHCVFLLSLSLTRSQMIFVSSSLCPSPCCLCFPSFVLSLSLFLPLSLVQYCWFEWGDW